MVAELERRGVDLRWEDRLDALDRRADHVSAWVRRVAGGRTRQLRARYLIGCDGARSAVRSRLRVAFGGSTFVQRWLVVDALVDRPLATAGHPHFVGDVERPIVCLPMSPGRHRWEWMLEPGENADEFLAPDRIEALLAPWIDDERVAVERAVVYTFHARMASRWRAGRVLLAGDAAHVVPPFVGQGFSSGARDAANLAWKLDAVLNGAPERLLDSYEAERRPHAASMQSLAVSWGRVVQTTTPHIGWMRDALIVGLERARALDWIQAHAKPLPTYATGAFAQRPHRLPFRRTVGALFPQPTVDGERLDDLLGPGWGAVSTSSAAAEAFGAAGLGVLELPGDQWLGRHEVEWALLRPDRFVFACGSAGDAGAAISSLRRLVGNGLRSAPVRVSQAVAA